jgi:hypothetical protein
MIWKRISSKYADHTDLKLELVFKFNIRIGLNR